MKEKQMSDLEDIKRWRGDLLRQRIISIRGNSQNADR